LELKIFGDGLDAETGAILRNTNSFAVDLVRVLLSIYLFPLSCLTPSHVQLLALASTEECRSYLQLILSGIARVLDHGNKKESMTFLELAGHARALCAGFAVSASRCPPLVRTALRAILEATRGVPGQQFRNVAASAFFLHFVCPALLQPTAYKLLSSQPSSTGLTNLMCVSPLSPFVSPQSD
jgi:hypothetical protein